MTITFTLQSPYTGATYVAGPFNISGTTTGGTTYQLATGVTKNQLISGYTINTTYETLSGGTIQSTGTCSTSQEWLTGIGGGGGGGGSLVDLQVYGKDLDGTPANASVYYQVNSGTTEYLTTLDPLTNSCSLIGTITGLTLGDIVTIGTDQTYAMVGVGSSTCPGSVELSYRIAPTPGNETVIATGYTQYGGTYPSSASRNYYTNPVILTGATFDDIFFDTVWIKIQDTVTDGYIIENVKIHSESYYDPCMPICDFSGGSATASITPTPTPTEIIYCDFNSGTATATI